MTSTRSAQIQTLTDALPSLFGPDFDAARARLGRLCAVANLASIKTRPGRIVGGAR